jgi:hypothetical protein
VKWVASSVLVPELRRGSLADFDGVGWIRYRCSISFRITKQLSAALNVMRLLPLLRVRVLFAMNATNNCEGLTVCVKAQKKCASNKQPRWFHIGILKQS